MFLKLIEGHVLDALKTLPSDYVDLIVTSPPYWGPRNYGIETNTIWDGDPNCEHVFGEEIVGRKTGGPQFGAEGAEEEREIDKARRFSFKSQFCLKCNAWFGQLGLEPTPSLYLSHLLQITGELKRVLKKTGVMYWNHGDCYGGSGQGAQTGYGDYKQKKVVGSMGKVVTLSATPKCMVMQNYRLVQAMLDDQGWILRNILIWYKINGMPSSVTDRFSNMYEPVFMLVKNKEYYFDLESVKVPYTAPINRWGGEMSKGYAGKFKNSGEDAKLFSSPRARIQHPGGLSLERGRSLRPNPSKNPGDVWSIPTQPFPEAHFAVYPATLIEPMIKSGCPKEICPVCGKARERIIEGTSGSAFNIRVRDVQHGRIKSMDRVASEKEVMNYEEGTTHAGTSKRTVGWTTCSCNLGYVPGIVLDPFCGSGTTLKVSRSQQVSCIGIEINKKYLDMAKRRCGWGSCVSGIDFEYVDVTKGANNQSI